MKTLLSFFDLRLRTLDLIPIGLCLYDRDASAAALRVSSCGQPLVSPSGFVLALRQDERALIRAARCTEEVARRICE